MKKIEKIITYNDTDVELENKILIKSKNIIYLRNKNEIKSDFETIIIDNYKNNISTKNFLFNTKNKILKAKDVKIKDIDGNITTFDNFFSNVSKNEFYGKDIKINFANNTFGNSSNEPRLYGNIFESNNNSTIISKGAFTTCKKRDGCPPWTIKADKVIHDKKKRTINYLNAWLEVYDKPILYFQSFFIQTQL